jgi:transposase
MADRGFAVSIPTKRNRTVQIPHDVALYAKRHAVENFFLSLKDWCRVATCRDKTAVSYMAFVHTTATLVNKRKTKLCS